MEINTSERLVELHSELLNELGHTYNAYLVPNLTTDLTVNLGWERDKKSLILFTHAALENYIEVISLLMLEDAEHHFIYNRTVNETLLHLIWTKCNHKPNFNDEEWDQSNRELLVDEVKELSKTFRNEVQKNNHGIKLKNLNNLLRTVALELPKSSVLRSALDDLTDLRGEFAHRFLERGTKAQRIKNSKGPEEIQKVVINSYRLAYRLYLSALSSIADEYAKKALKVELLTLLQTHANEKLKTQEQDNTSLFAIAEPSSEQEKVQPPSSATSLDPSRKKKKRKKKKRQRKRKQRK
ncbi:HEPN domain-containing protein [Vibrio chagasii]|uniref:HEPN domain-containing protein n=1 Tax=Vibrio chagasii TaxID=170679 RepID=UPI001EFE30C8|nr:HEPN domain-containing protein [Vibrio chagasii]MCG9565939.1 hypothetical protein [Vibrio chagasii]